MESKRDQVEEIELLLARHERKLAEAFRNSENKLRDDVTLSEVEEAIRQGQVSTIPDFFDEAVITAAFADFIQREQEVFIDGGKLGSRIASANRIEFIFDVTQEGPAKWFREQRAEKIVQIGDEARSTIRQILDRDVPAGEPPAKVARKIREHIGLTAHQEQAVDNYRRYLDELDNQALQRKLRDKRFDPTIARALREGKPLTEQQKDKMVNAFRRRYINRRALNIAQTESLTMLNGGQNEYFEELVRSGKVPPQAIKRKWIVTRDSRLRDAHAAIPRMNPEGRARGEAFQSPLGLIRYPGDPQASAGNRINCRCALFIRIDSDAI